MPSVLCISGLDPSGHSGLSADIRALDFMGIACLPVASVLTVQDSGSFTELQEVPAGLLARQVRAVCGGSPPEAAKVGMLGSADQVRQVAELLADIEVPAIVDPVFASSSGFRVLDGEMLDAYRHDLIPVSALVTPNAPEAGEIAGMDVRDLGSAEEACRRILDLGPGAVLVKGGHLADGKGTDVLADAGGMRRLGGGAVPGDVRGTGCAYSALIAGHAASGMGMSEAAMASKRIMARAIRSSVRAGSAKLILGRPRRLPE